MWSAVRRAKDKRKVYGRAVRSRAAVRESFRILRARSLHSRRAGARQFVRTELFVWQRSGRRPVLRQRTCCCKRESQRRRFPERTQRAKKDKAISRQKFYD